MRMTEKEIEELKEIGRQIQKEKWWQEQPWITTKKEIEDRKKMNKKVDGLTAIEDIWFKIGNGKMNLEKLKKRESISSLKTEINQLKQDKNYLRARLQAAITSKKHY